MVLVRELVAKVINQACVVVHPHALHDVAHQRTRLLCSAHVIVEVLDGTLLDGRRVDGAPVHRVARVLALRIVLGLKGTHCFRASVLVEVHGCTHRGLAAELRSGPLAVHQRLFAELLRCEGSHNFEPLRHPSVPSAYLALGLVLQHDHRRMRKLWGIPEHGDVPGLVSVA